MVACDFLWHSCIFVLVWQARILGSSLPQTEHCPKLLKEFADVVSNYTYCAVRNSRPFRFCCACEEAYMTALHGYRHIVLDEGCHDDLVMAEKYQIVEAAYNFVVHLWESSNCPACFTNDQDGTPLEIKPEVTEFFEKLDVVEHCFFNNSQIHIYPIPVNHSAANSSSIGPNVCDACNEPYRTLDAAYKKITESAPQEFSICADVSASMNYTRQRWSNNFHCVKIHTDLVSVVALTVFFCFLPIIFYLSLKMQGDSHNRNTGTSLPVNEG